MIWTVLIVPALAFLGAIVSWYAIRSITDEIAKILNWLVFIFWITLFLITSPWFIKVVLLGVLLAIPHTLPCRAVPHRF